MLFVTVELVEALQRELIDRYGGSHGLRDRGLLESSVARAENMAYYNPQASVADVASSLGWGLIKNHAFVDGNKRTGLAAVIIFLDLNGMQLRCTEQEEVAAVLGIAASNLSEEAWIDWLSQRVEPI